MRKASFLALSVLLVALFAAPASSQGGATIMLLHGIPGVPVDVYVGDEVAIEGFEPAAMQDLSAFAGATLEDVAVVPAGGERADAVIEVPSLSVPGSGNWTVVAHLDGDGNPALTPFENDTSQIAAGEGRVTVRHAAAAPAVDIVVGDDRPFTGLANGDEASADLPAGPLPAEIAAAGGDVLASAADILGQTPSLAEGANTILYAVGSLDDDTFDLYVQAISGLGTSPTAVDTGNSPINDPTSAATGLWVLIAAGLGVTAVGGGVALRSARNRS
jgi:hypothetical protein